MVRMTEWGAATGGARKPATSDISDERGAVVLLIARKVLHRVSVGKRFILRDTSAPAGADSAGCLTASGFCARTAPPVSLSPFLGDVSHGHD